MTQGQDVNQQVSTPVATAAAVPAGNSAEPTGDQGARMRDWEAANNNKSQQIAAERRAFEAEKAAWSASRGQGPQNGGAPTQPQGQVYGQPPKPQQFMPSNFQSLVNQFGYEAASEMVAAQNQQAGVLLDQLKPVVDQFNAAQSQYLLTAIDQKGQGLYGDEYKEKRNDVLNLIMNGDPQRGVPPGAPLEYAMFVLRGGEDGLRQRYTDQAYQQQQQKQDGNASQQGAGPSPAATAQVTGIDAAIAAAKKEIGWQD